jgi:transcriptional regulator GlxA family with amidase domain
MSTKNTLKVYPLEDYSERKTGSIMPVSSTSDKYENTNPLKIGFLVYPGVIQLDVMAAHQVLSFPPNTQVDLVAQDLTPIVSNEGLIITPTITIDNCPQLDVICVPGGGM